MSECLSELCLIFCLDSCQNFVTLEFLQTFFILFSFVFLRFSQFFFILLRFTGATGCKLPVGEFHSEPVCTEPVPVRNFPKSLYRKFTKQGGGEGFYFVDISKPIVCQIYVLQPGGFHENDSTITIMTNRIQTATNKEVECRISGHHGNHGNDENHENPGCKQRAARKKTSPTSVGVRDRAIAPSNHTP